MTTVLELPLRGAGGEPVDLVRTINSHGFAELAPMHLDESESALDLTLRIPRSRPRRVRISPARRRGLALVTVFGPALSAGAAERVLAAAARVLRLDADLSGFYAAIAKDPDFHWVTMGAGRMLRSPTVFEDVVKTICTTNCSWGLTMKMVNSFVSELGDPPAGVDDPLARAFPTPQAMAAQPLSFYREVVRAGYRAPYFMTLSRAVASGELDLEAFALASREELADGELEGALLALPGVGPYAAAHIMMTLGRDSRLILDSWSRPKYARLVGKRSVTDTAIVRRFRKYGEHAGLAFWLFVTKDWVAPS